MSVFPTLNDRAEVPRTHPGLITIIHFKSTSTTKLVLCMLLQVPHWSWVLGCLKARELLKSTASRSPWGNCWNVVYLQTVTTAPVFHNRKVRLEKKLRRWRLREARPEITPTSLLSSIPTMLLHPSTSLHCSHGAVKAARAETIEQTKILEKLVVILLLRWKCPDPASLKVLRILEACLLAVLPLWILWIILPWIASVFLIPIFVSFLISYM